MPAEDDDLLGRLAQALRPPAAGPSEAEIAALHRAVSEGVAAPATRRVWPRRALAGAAAAAVLLVIISGAPVPRPIRVAAHAVGLPVDSVEVADARSAARELERALDEDDQEAIARASARLRRRLEALGQSDRQRLNRRTEPLLQRAGAPPSSPPAPTPPPPGGRMPSAPPSTTSSTSRTSSSSSSSSSSTSSTTTTARTSTTGGGTSSTTSRR